AFRAIHELHWSYVRQRAERKLADAALAAPVAEQTYAIRFKGMAEVCNPGIVSCRLAPKNGQGPAQGGAKRAIFVCVEGLVAHVWLRTCAPPRQAGWGRGDNERPSSYEPALHPGKRGGGGVTTNGLAGYEPALHPGKRGGARRRRTALLVTN